MEKYWKDSGWILRGFCEDSGKDSGRILEGFWEDSGGILVGFWKDSGGILEGFWKDSEAILEGLWCGLAHIGLYWLVVPIELYECHWPLSVPIDIYSSPPFIS